MTRQPLGASRAQKGNSLFIYYLFYEYLNSIFYLHIASKLVKKTAGGKKSKAKKVTIKKASLKKARTMEQTAKEGKAYVKRLNKKSK